MTIEYKCSKCEAFSDRIGMNIFESALYEFCLCDDCLNELKEWIKKQ